MPTQERTSTRKKQRKPMTQSSPPDFPRKGGKIRFPAPKNMANKAKPETKNCRVRIEKPPRTAAMRRVFF